MTDSKEPDDILEGPASLSADGTLEQRMDKMEPAGGPTLPPLPADAPKLELADRSPKAIQARVETYRAELRSRSSRPWALKLVVFCLLAGAGGLAALLHFKPELQLQLPAGVRDATILDQLTTGGERPPVIINSTPPGARIFIEGKPIGETPWAGENVWHGEPSMLIQLRGYKTWEGKLKGGQTQTLDVQLKK